MAKKLPYNSPKLRIQEQELEEDIVTTSEYVDDEYADDKFLW